MTDLKRALIVGITGQDGAYLAELLLNKGYRVFGTSRDASSCDMRRLRALKIETRVELVSMLPSDFRSALHTISRCQPNEIYFLAGQSSVGLSFEQPVDAIESIATGALNLLEAIRYLNADMRLFNAGSSECFGDTGGALASEETPFRPLSPYAVAKVCAQNLVTNYRTAYSMFACTGILFNHESPLRPERFVTQKIVRGAAGIAATQNKRGALKLGNLDIASDWGWAPEYVAVMWQMLQQPTPDDFVIATGRTVSLEYFVNRVFQNFGLDWQRHVSIDDGLRRPSDIHVGAANPGKAARVLSWTAHYGVDHVIDSMCANCRVDCSVAATALPSTPRQ